MGPMYKKEICSQKRRCDIVVSMFSCRHIVVGSIRRKAIIIFIIGVTLGLTQSNENEFRGTFRFFWELLEMEK